MNQPPVILVNNPAAAPSRVTIHEHLAPAADSARLLAELEAQARDKVTASIRLANTPCDCVISEWHDTMGDEVLLRAVLAINGRRITVDVRQPGRPSPAHYEALARAVAERIAAEILAQPVAAAKARRFGRG
jgi:hypothetical protein